MTDKKKLISRMALGTGVVLAVALLTVGAGFLGMRADRERFDRRQASDRQQAVGRARDYLGTVAKRVVKVPVDPSLVSEIESHYFEEQANGRIAVWAMGTNGEFLFGVPREAFSRLNAIYDREITPRLKEGVFLDRQSFLLGHLDEGEETVPPADLADERVESGRPWVRFPGRSDLQDGGFVLSTPIKTADGGGLGSLYLKRAPGPPEEYRTDEALDAVAKGGAIVAMLACVFLWVLLPTWVYVDARERGVRRAPLFAFLTVLSSLIGLVVYLIARPEDSKVLACPGCGREVNGGAYCPHCGRDLSASFCAACRYPLKPDWVFCPSCRAEIKVRPAPAEAAPAPG